MSDDASDWLRFGEHMADARRRAGLTQAELADRVRLHPNTISNYESGRVPQKAPRVPTGYYAVAEVLAMSGADVERLPGGPSGTVDPPARMVTSRITHIADCLTADAEGLAEDLQRFAARAGQGKFLGDEARNLTEHMVRLTWQASKLDGMREMAEIYNAEEAQR